MKTKVLSAGYITITLIVLGFFYLFLKGNESVTSGMLRRNALDRSEIRQETKQRNGCTFRGENSVRLFYLSYEKKSCLKRYVVPLTPNEKRCVVPLTLMKMGLL